MSVLNITNPRTGQVDCELNNMSSATVADVASEMREHQKGWQQQTVAQRIGVLEQFADVLTENKQALVDALINDTGRYNETLLEVDVTISGIRRWCKQAPEILALHPARNGEIPFLSISQTHMPYSLVGVISPWNFPLLLSLVDAIPALIAGCSILLKPSEETSRFALQCC